MTTNQIALVVFPYIAIVLAVVLGIVRYKNRQNTHTSMSTQFLEGRTHFWGSVPWHYGILLVLIGHILALFFPSGILAWNGSPVRLYLLETTGLALGLFAFIGLLLLLYRRVANPRVASESNGLNYIVLIILLIQVVTGLAIATMYRWGSSWGAGSLTPYLWSLLSLRPDIDLIATMPFLVKLHIFNAFLFILLLPFTPLVHIFSVPLSYAGRPPQVVIWNRLREKTETQSYHGYVR